MTIPSITTAQKRFWKSIGAIANKNLKKNIFCVVQQVIAYCLDIDVKKCLATSPPGGGGGGGRGFPFLAMDYKDACCLNLFCFCN